MTARGAAMVSSSRGWSAAVLGMCTLLLVSTQTGAQSGRNDLLAHAGYDAHAAHRAEAARGQHKIERSVHVYKVPDVTLLEMTGTKVPLPSLLRGDAPIFLNFIFTTCTSVCPVMSATFAEVQRQLGDEAHRVRMISISIDPEHDDPARLREFARKHDAGPGWRFLTGRPDDIVAVQRAFNSYRGNKMSHAPSTFLRMSASDAWVRVDGLASASDLVNEYRRGVAK
ncbi:MAG: SCO family protein [Vicinamibacterales bacterium]